MKTIQFPSGMKIYTDHPEKFPQKKDGSVILGDPYAQIDLSGCPNGQIVRIGKKHFFRLVHGKSI